MFPGVVIFARMNSKRLPGKMLKKIGNKSLLLHIIDRVRKLKNKNTIILATSKKKSDDKLVTEAKKRKIKIFRGNLDNVVNRAYQCCLKFNLDSIVRICGDRIFLDYKDIDRSILKFQKNKKTLDMASNLLKGEIPSGKTIEIINFQALKKIINNTSNKKHLEHVTTYIYENKKKFRLLKLHRPLKSKFKFSYSIDKIEDLKRTQFIAKKVKNLTNLSSQKIFELTKKWYQNN